MRTIVFAAVVSVCLLAMGSAVTALDKTGVIEKDYGALELQSAGWAIRF